MKNRIGKLARTLTLMAVMLAPAVAMACVYSSTHNYYLFSAYHRSQMENSFTTQLQQYWSEYTGEEIDSWTIEGLERADFSEPESNSIVAAATRKGDKGILAYLQSLSAYLRASFTLNNRNEWNYPTKEELAAARATVQKTISAARTYAGWNLQPQYTLLEMRAQFALQQWQAVADLWNEKASRLKPSVFRNMAQDLYAGALLRQGHKREACDIYAELGDMLSLRWCVRDRRNLAGITQEWQENPNSPTLTFLVQDFVNNAQETADGNRDLKSMGIEGIRENEMRGMIALAGQVVASKKSQTDALWLAAAGYLHVMLGEAAQGVTLLERATKASGTQRMRDNARTCLILARVAAAEKSTQKLDIMLAKELEWLRQMAVAEEKASPGANHYLEALHRLMAQELPLRYQQWGDHTRFNTALDMKRALAAIEHSIGNPDGQLQLVDATRFDHLYFTHVDSLTSRQMESYRQYLLDKQKNPLDAWIKSHSVVEDRADLLQWTADLVGTKCMREADWTRALTWLEQVTPQWIADNQHIAPYMAARHYNYEPWMVTQDRVQYWTGPVSLDANKKAEYCIEIIDLITTFESEPNALDAYMLATRLYQGSYAGQCWFLTRYSQQYGDTICFEAEADLVSMAVKYLERAFELSAGDFKMHEACAYALAWIPRGQELYPMVWDSRASNYVTVLNRNSPQFGWMQELMNLSADPRVSPFVSRCGTLRKFRKEV